MALVLLSSKSPISHARTRMRKVPCPLRTWTFIVSCLRERCLAIPELRDETIGKSAPFYLFPIMKKLLISIFVILISFNAIHAEITWSLSNNGILTISGTDMPDYGSYVYSKESPWYSQREKIKKIVIEEGVTNVGDYAFYGCSRLTSAIMPNSVTKIGRQAFRNCSNLISVIIPNSVIVIGEEAFRSCSCLASVTIASSVTTIGQRAFSGCSEIKELYSWNANPPTAYSETFNEMNTTHTKIFVPEGASETYKYAPIWKGFVNIYEMEYSPVLSASEPITVSDAIPTVIKGYYKENTVTYLREGAAISKDNYASFCLPFAVDPADAQFKAVYVPVGIALYNTETNTLRIGFYKSNEIIPAGTPFLAKLTVDDKVEVKNALPVNYDSNEPAVKAKVIRTFDFYERSGIMSENDNYSISFTGTYKKISPANACTFNIDGSAGPSANVYPFRAYVALTKNTTNAKMIFCFNEDAETTGISQLQIANDKASAYDLNGRVVNEKLLESGIYIKNGKKYVK